MISLLSLRCDCSARDYHSLSSLVSVSAIIKCDAHMLVVNRSLSLVWCGSFVVRAGSNKRSLREQATPIIWLLAIGDCGPFAIFCACYGFDHCSGQTVVLSTGTPT